MIQRVIDTLQNGASAGMAAVNDSIDSAIYIDPEEQIEAEAQMEAEKEIDAENDRIDKLNAKIDDKVEETRSKVDQFNNSFDQGVAKTKEKIKEISKSDIATAYRCARLVYWGNLAKDYIAEHPDWAANMRDKVSQFGKSAATRLRELGISDYADDETEEICNKRDAMFGAPDATVEGEAIPDTDMILQGAVMPEMTQVLELGLG